MRADLCRGYSARGRQSASVAFCHCEAAKSRLARIVARAPKGHEAPKKSLAQRAKVGYFRCCVTLADIAAPPSFAIGEWVDLRVCGARLWARHGPWAAQYVGFAARWALDGIGRRAVPAVPRLLRGGPAAVLLFPLSLCVVASVNFFACIARSTCVL